MAFAESHLPQCPSTIRFAWRVVPCNRTIPAERPGVFDVLICCYLLTHEMTPMKAFSRHSLVMLSRLIFLCAWPPARSTTRSREAPMPFQGKGAPGLSTRSGPTLFPPLPPQKGWGRIQKVYLDYEKRGVDPKWTLYKRNEVIRKFGLWMDFWMLKCIRNIPVKKVWTRFVIDRDWRRVKKGTPGPVGLRDCINLCKMLEPGNRYQVLARKNGTRRHGRSEFSKKESSQKALALLAVQGSQERAEGKLMNDESC